MDIHESLKQILSRPQHDLGDLFYQVFLEEFPEVQSHFRNTNLHRQAIMMTNALQIIVSHATHFFPATAAYLQVLGNRHYRDGIPKDLYPKFREALLVALGKFHGGDWSEPLRQQWQTAIDHAADGMLKGYVPEVLHI
jgi:hemoglobin-like flavoprotein